MFACSFVYKLLENEKHEETKKKSQQQSNRRQEDSYFRTYPSKKLMTCAESCGEKEELKETGRVICF